MRLISNRVTFPGPPSQGGHYTWLSTHSSSSLTDCCQQETDYGAWIRKRIAFTLLGRSFAHKMHNTHKEKQNGTCFKCIFPYDFSRKTPSPGKVQSRQTDAEVHADLFQRHLRGIKQNCFSPYFIRSRSKTADFARFKRAENLPEALNSCTTAHGPTRTWSSDKDDNNTASLGQWFTSNVPEPLLGDIC